MTDWKGIFSESLIVGGAMLAGTSIFSLWGLEALGIFVGAVIIALGVRIHEGE